MKEEILKICLKKGILLDSEMSEILSKLDLGEVERLIDRIITQSNEKLITKSFLSKNFDKISYSDEGEKRTIEKLGLNLGLSLEITREKIEKVEVKNIDCVFRNIKILSSVKQLSRKIEVGDFVKHFRSRVVFLKNILQERAELENLLSINKIIGNRQNVSVIGIVSTKRITKNKNILIEIEDLTGKIRILINQNKPEVYEIAKSIMLDDVISVKGTGDREFIFVNHIFYPDCNITDKIKLDREESAVFISDLHVGNRAFLENNFLKFIDWINGKVGDEEHVKEALKVKYIFVTGDSVDGVGVRPGQEEDLKIKDIKEQYVKLAELLEKIRKDITIIMCPGQHDAVRVAEPQPAVEKEYAAPLFELENLILVSNPAFVEITNNNKRGIKVLMYHGASFHSYISNIESLRLGKANDTPSKVVREILKRRHLASFHSSVVYIPNGIEDNLLIKETPDIITTGEMHKSDIDIYNNILIICSSCWQTATPYEEKVGSHPDPCKVPILNLKTRQVKILDFSGEGE